MPKSFDYKAQVNIDPIVYAIRKQTRSEIADAACPHIKMARFSLYKILRILPEEEEKIRKEVGICIKFLNSADGMITR